MKIVCDACGAKYAIADEKVRGKVFKIRCKKCSNVIVVRGTSADDAASEAADDSVPKDTRTYDYDEGSAGTAQSDAVWHLVIDQGQVGPVTEEEVRERYARGEIDAETYAWREGFDNWLPLSSIDAFAELATAAPGAGAGAAAAVGGDEATQAAPGADLFSTSSSDVGADAGADLFGTSASGGDGLFADAGGADERRMRGERNENSVLFSLNNLAALASDSPRAAAPSRAAAPAASTGGGLSGGGVGLAAGMAQSGGDEGSGLIDIRSMAQSYMADKDKAASSPGAAPAFGAIEPVGFTAQPSVLLPPTQPAGSSNKTLYAIIGALVALLAIGGVSLAVLLSGGDEPSVATGPTDPGASAQAANPDDDGAKEPSGDEPAAKPSGDEPKEDDSGGDDSSGAAAANAGGDDSARTAAAAARTEPDDKKPTRTERPRSRSSSSRRSSDSRSSDSRSSDSKPSDSKPSESSSSSRSGKCMDEVACLLADRPPPCCSKYTKKSSGGSSGRSSGSNSNLPEKLTRSDITNGINRVRGRVSACGGKHPGKGQVKVTVKVAGSGSVSSVSVKSSPSAALGSCVAKEVKRAKFSKSQQGATFTYPFVFN
ncbi:GYF domain-containing protein [Haliangium sp.]|uniref:GYF domain-containing protein n=1 Tax=Haliangium sp. TaxID=2663208 RepID=UPI003D0CCC99